MGALGALADVEMGLCARKSGPVYWQILEAIQFGTAKAGLENCPRSMFSKCSLKAVAVLKSPKTCVRFHDLSW